MNTRIQASGTRTVTCTQTDADTYTLPFWKAYKAWGGRAVVYVGISGTGTTSGRVSRVTTRSVCVKIGDHITPVHPGDLRPANPNAIGAMRRAGIING